MIKLPTLPNAWTPIAWRRLQFADWTMFLDAPIDVETAPKLQAAGRILMANQHTGERVELVVRGMAQVRLSRPPSTTA